LDLVEEVEGELLVVVEGKECLANSGVIVGKRCDFGCGFG